MTISCLQKDLFLTAHILWIHPLNVAFHNVLLFSVCFKKGRSCRKSWTLCSCSLRFLLPFFKTRHAPKPPKVVQWSMQVNLHSLSTVSLSIQIKLLARKICIQYLIGPYTRERMWNKNPTGTKTAKEKWSRSWQNRIIKSMLVYDHQVTSCGPLVYTEVGKNSLAAYTARFFR